MQEVGNEGVHGAEAAGGREIDPEAALARLEDRVERAVDRIRTLVEERDALQSTLAEKEQALETAGGDSEQVGALEARLKALGEERDRLREERTSAALRVEAILERLEALGLE